MKYGSDLSANLASTLIYQAGFNRAAYFKKIEKAKDLKQNWFKYHKTRLVQKRGWAAIGDREIEKRGEPLIGKEDVYLKLREKGWSDDQILTLCRRDFRFFSKLFFQHYLKYPDSELHKWLYALYQREINKTHIGCKWAIAAPRGNAKCLKYNTLIQLEDGKLKEIKDINIGDSILCIDDNYKLSVDTIISKENTGVREVRDIIFSSGRKITTTSDHRLFNIHGEIRVDNLSVGDKIATPRKLICNVEKNTMSLSEAVFLANIIAEGCLAGGKEGIGFRCSYTNFDKEVVDDFRKSCEDLGFVFRSSKNQKGLYNISKARPYLREKKLDKCLSINKLIPEEVFLQDNKFLSVFLSRFFATDGWISKYNLCAGVTLANEKLIHQLFTIFLRLGFLPRIQYKPNDKNNAWAIVIYGENALRRLASIGVLHKQSKLEKTIEKFGGGKHNPNVDTIDIAWKEYFINTTPWFIRKLYGIRLGHNYHISREKLKRVAVADRNPFFYNLATSDIFWDEIKEISAPYYTVTYDIETRKYHNFIANNIVSHNSSLSTLFLPLWCVLFEKKHFIVIISDTASQAEDFLREIKTELLSNIYIKKFFPHLCVKTDIWRLDEIITNNDIRIIALGSQSKILGRRHKAYRPDLFCLDDLENQDNVSSALMRERLEEWFTKEVLKAGAIDGSSDFFVIGTIKHEDSLLNNLINSNKFPAWSGKLFRAVIDFASNEDLWGEWAEIYSNRDDEDRFETARKFFEEHKEEMLDGTHVLWPEGEPYYKLMEIRQESDVAFSSEKQNYPINRDKCLIQPEEIRYYTDKDIENRQLIVFGALDPAVGKSKGNRGDYAAIVTVGKCPKSGKVFVLDSWAYKRKVEVQIKEIFKRHGRYNYHRFGVESTAFQVVLKDHIEKLSRYLHIYLPVEEIKHSSRQNKEARIEWMYPHLKSGVVYFHESQKQLIEQVCNWTPDGRALYDDLVDCLSMVLRIALGKHFRLLTW